MQKEEKVHSIPFLKERGEERVLLIPFGRTALTCWVKDSGKRGETTLFAKTGRKDGGILDGVRKLPLALRRKGQHTLSLRSDP